MSEDVQGPPAPVTVSTRIRNDASEGTVDPDLKKRLKDRHQVRHLTRIATGWILGFFAILFASLLLAALCLLLRPAYHQRLGSAIAESMNLVRDSAIIESAARSAYVLIGLVIFAATVMTLSAVAGLIRLSNDSEQDDEKRSLLNTPLSELVSAVREIVTSFKGKD